MSQIQNWYAGKTIFITGATGFMGKVLLEKILRDLPEVKSVILLIRPKRGVNPAKRFDSIKNLPVFERLNALNPNAFQKVILIEGNIDEPNIGLSAANRRKLINVSVVFHMAATVRFDSEVKIAIAANLLGTQMILELCKNMLNLQCFVHLSTTFCYPEREILDENIYAPHCNPYEFINFVHNDSKILQTNDKRKLIAPHPNTYTFSKRLAEWLVKDYATIFPVAIARPSIVIPCLLEPTPGWVDSLNGPMGVSCAAGKGVLRSMLAVESHVGQIIPCDLAINAIITIPTKQQASKQKLTVYNLNIPNKIVSMSWGEYIRTGEKILRKYPFELMLWYPGGSLRTNVYMHWLVLILFQWIPALLIDMILFLIRRERFMVKVQKRIMVGLDALQYFASRAWHFDTKNYEELSDSLTGKDEQIFYQLKTKYDINEYLTAAMLTIKKYMFKENIENLTYPRNLYKFLFVLHYTVKSAFYYFIIGYLLNLIGLNSNILLFPLSILLIIYN